jgi:hypothetical protein
MPPFLYRCPDTGDNVQAWANDEPDDDDFTYVQVRCLACAHLTESEVERLMDAARKKRWGHRDGFAARRSEVVSARLFDLRWRV